MHWILDGAVTAIILGCAVAAWRKGFIRAVFGFLPIVAALLGTKAVSPYIGKFLRGTFLFDRMSNAIQNSMGLDTAIQEGAMQTQTAAIEAMPLPEFLKQTLLENNNPVIYQLLSADNLKEYIAGYLANVCINIVSVVLAFVLIFIAVRVVMHALHLFTQLPGLNLLNRSCGFLVGVAKGLCIVWMIGILLTFFQCSSAWSEFLAAMEQTVFAGYLYENNLLLHLVLTIFT